MWVVARRYRVAAVGLGRFRAWSDVGWLGAATG